MSVCRFIGLSTGICHIDSSGVATSSTIVNADVNAAAAIAGTKVSPNFGAQDVITTAMMKCQQFKAWDADGSVYFNVANYDTGSGRLEWGDSTYNNHFQEAIACDLAIVSTGGGGIVGEIMACHGAMTSGATSDGFSVNATGKGPSTTDATQTTMATVAIAIPSSGGLFVAQLTALKSDGSVVFTITVKAPYKQISGAVTLGTVVQTGTDSIGTTAGMDGTLVASAGNILIKGTGLAATTFRWLYSYQYNLRTTAV